MLGMIFLSDSERDQLRAQHRRERDGRVRDRIKAVLKFRPVNLSEQAFA